jgi:hypothetical protein
MEHWIRLMDSDTALSVAIFVFTFGVIIWLAWARFCPDRHALQRTSHFLMALAALVLFGAKYAHVVANGLDGVVCAAGRFSTHATCFTRDDSPVGFWTVAAALLFLSGALLLASVACVIPTLSPAKRRVTADGGTGYPRTRPGVERAASVKAGRWSAIKLLSAATVVLPLAWMAAVFHQAEGVRGQVAEVLASATGRQVAVEEYLRNHGVLPEDSEALGLPLSAELRGRHVRETGIFRGSIILTLDGTLVDEHLRGRVVVLVAVSHHRAIAWHCASPDIDDRYLPRECRRY